MPRTTAYPPAALQTVSPRLAQEAAMRGFLVRRRLKKLKELWESSRGSLGFRVKGLIKARKGVDCLA